MSYKIGALVRLSATFSTGSALVDPTVVEFSIKPPSGIRSTYTYPTGVQKLAVGSYFYDYYSTEYGQHPFRWYSSGSVIGADEDYFIVDPSEVI